MIGEDHCGDLGALFGGDLRAGAGLAGRRLRAIIAGLGFRLHLAVVAAFAALRVHLAVVTAFATFSLHVVVARVVVAALGFHVAVLALAAFCLHVLAALGLVLRAHALRLLTGCGFFGALALGRAGRGLFGLRGLCVGRGA